MSDKTSLVDQMRQDLNHFFTRPVGWIVMLMALVVIGYHVYPAIQAAMAPQQPPAPATHGSYAGTGTGSAPHTSEK